MYIPRYLEAKIRTIHETFKVLYVGGARQVGKSTLLEHLAASFGIKKISMDDVALRKLAQTDPDLFLQQFPAPLFIDEVQYAPELFSAIKLRVDRTEERGQYWLSGSQHFSLIKGLQESLAGRVGIVTLYNLSQGEEYGYPFTLDSFLPGKSLPAAQAKPLPAVMERIFRGSFPVLVADPKLRREDFYQSYIQTYLDRDVSGVFGVEKIRDFHTMLELLAARTGQVLNLSMLARDAGVSVNAVKDWLSVLESSGLIFFLRPYFTNITKRLVKAPKVYFTDTGLAAYLTKWQSAETLQKGAMAGALFETAAVMEIVKSYEARGRTPPLYYYRDHQGREVDVVIEQDGQVFPIEIKMSSQLGKDDVKHLRFFATQEKNVGKSAVICSALQAVPFDRTIDVVPLSLIV